MSCSWIQLIPCRPWPILPPKPHRAKVASRVKAPTCASEHKTGPQDNLVHLRQHRSGISLFPCLTNKRCQAVAEGRVFIAYAIGRIAITVRRRHLNPDRWRRGNLPHSPAEHLRRLDPRAEDFVAMVGSLHAVHRPANQIH